jgi:hypothetical protein
MTRKIVMLVMVSLRFDIEETGICKTVMLGCGYYERHGTRLLDVIREVTNFVTMSCYRFKSLKVSVDEGRRTHPR